MIHHVRYICPIDGLEKTTQNISYETVMSYNIYEGKHDIEGMINSKTYMNIKCVCGETHDFLVDSKSNII